MKRKLNKKDFIFSGLENQTLVKLPGQINNNSFLLENLKNCTVFLCDRISTIYIDKCVNCRISIGPVFSSVFVRWCSDVEVRAAAQQVRISFSKNVKAFIFSETHTTLEDSEEVEIAPYNFSYSEIKEHFKKTELDICKNDAFKVLDFTPKPNSFRVMKLEDFAGTELSIEFEENTFF